MALITRRYQQQGPTNNDLAENVQAGATVMGFSGGVIDVQIDDAISGSVETLDEFMGSIGFEFLVQAPMTATVLRLRSPNGTIKSISVENDDVLSAGSKPVLMPGVVTNPIRAFNTTFQPSATRPTLCCYSVRIAADISIGGAESGRVELVSDALTTPTTVQARMAHGLTGTVVVGVAITSITESVLSYLVPASHNVRLNTIDETTAPTYTLMLATEITL